MSRLSRGEDQADLWLREHDPYYTSKSKNKRMMLRHPYDTPEQEYRRTQAEIPLSSLSLSQIEQIGGQVSEDGDVIL